MVKHLPECFSFLKVVPSLWNVDGEVTVPEQKPGEVAEELASSYERKLIEVRPAQVGPTTPVSDAVVISNAGCSGIVEVKARLPQQPAST